MKKMIYTLLIGLLLPGFITGQTSTNQPEKSRKNGIQLLHHTFNLTKYLYRQDTILSTVDTSLLKQKLEQFKKFKILIAGEQKRAYEVLSLYIQKKSISGNEKNAGVWLRDICEENGLIINQFGDMNGNFNFSASIYPLTDSLPNIIFLNHIDVVPAGDSTLWEYPPFAGHITETDVWGRGAFDNKGPAIMQLFSILQFRSEFKNIKLPYNVTLLSVCCEETLGKGGAQFVVENYLEILNPVCVIGEGATELGDIIKSTGNDPIYGISVAHKRPLWIELELKIATSDHGSVTPLQYANKEITIALSKLAKKKPKVVFTPINKGILKSIANHEKGIKKLILRNPTLFRPLLVSQLRKQPEMLALFTNTVTITGLNCNNETYNKIPGSVIAHLDCRLLPRQSNEQSLRYIRESLNNNDIKVRVHKKTDIMEYSSPSGEFYRDLKTAVQLTYPGSQVFPIMLPNYNDVGFFRAKGIQCYSIIPIGLPTEYLECVHGENERIPIDAIDLGIDTYKAFIENCMKNNSNEIEEIIL